MVHHLAQVVVQAGTGSRTSSTFFTQQGRFTHGYRSRDHSLRDLVRGMACFSFPNVFACHSCRSYLRPHLVADAHMHKYKELLINVAIALIICERSGELCASHVRKLMNTNIHLTTLSHHLSHTTVVRRPASNLAFKLLRPLPGSFDGNMAECAVSCRLSTCSVGRCPCPAFSSGRS